MFLSNLNIFTQPCRKPLIPLVRYEYKTYYVRRRTSSRGRLGGGPRFASPFRTEKGIFPRNN